MSYKKVLLIAPKGYRFDNTVDGAGRHFWYLALKRGQNTGAYACVLSPEIKVKGVKK